MSDQIEEMVEDVVQDQNAPEDIETPVNLNVVIIDGEEHRIKKMNARQIARLSNVLGKAMIAGTLEMQALRNAKNLNQSALLMSIMAALDEKMLIAFAAALVDLDEKVVEEKFDLNWVIDAFGKQLIVSDINGIIRNFTSLSSLIQ